MNTKSYGQFPRNLCFKFARLLDSGYLTLMTQPNQVHLQNVIWVHPEQSQPLNPNSEIVDSSTFHKHPQPRESKADTDRGAGEETDTDSRFSSQATLHMENGNFVLLVWDASNRNSPWKKKRKFHCKVLRHHLVNKTVPFFRMELFYFSVLNT